MSPETAKECDPSGEINDALKKKKLKAMKLIDTRTGFGLLDGQAMVSQSFDPSLCKCGSLAGSDIILILNVNVILLRFYLKRM